MIQNKPMLTICIPTYNRGCIVYECVKNILTYEGDDIEVVVSNNCSPDNTEELLLSIDDKRLIYTRTSENIGYRNLYRVIDHVRSDFCLVISDEDDIEVSDIKNFIEVIKKNPKAAGISGCKINAMGNITNDVAREFRTYRKGTTALKKFGLATHTDMSPFIFNKTLIDAQYKNSYTHKTHALVEIANNLCMEGDIISTPYTLYYKSIRTGDRDKSQAKIHTANNSTVAWVTPKGAIQQPFMLSIELLSKYNLNAFSKHYLAVLNMDFIFYITAWFSTLQPDAEVFKEVGVDGVQMMKEKMTKKDAFREMFAIMDEYLWSNSSFLGKKLHHLNCRFLLSIRYIYGKLRLGQLIRKFLK